MKINTKIGVISKELLRNQIAKTLIIPKRVKSEIFCEKLFIYYLLHVILPNPNTKEMIIITKMFHNCLKYMHNRNIL